MNEAAIVLECWSGVAADLLLAAARLATLYELLMRRLMLEHEGRQITGLS